MLAASNCNVKPRIEAKNEYWERYKDDEENPANFGPRITESYDD